MHAAGEPLPRKAPVSQTSFKVHTEDRLNSFQVSLICKICPPPGAAASVDNATGIGYLLVKCVEKTQDDDF